MNGADRSPVGARLASPAAAKKAPVRQPAPRYKDFDYRTSGAYFITVVTSGRACVFGSIADGILKPTQRGLIVERCWCDVPSHRPNVAIDAFIVMPNHFHAIVWIESEFAIAGEASLAPTTTASRDLRVGATLASPADAANPRVSSGSLSAIIGGFKSAVSREINKLRSGAAKELWQRSFYDRVIRDQNELTAFQNYIAANPQNWPYDEHNADAVERRTIDSFVAPLETLRETRARDAAAGEASLAPTENE